MRRSISANSGSKLAGLEGFSTLLRAVAARGSVPNHRRRESEKFPLDLRPIERPRRIARNVRHQPLVACRAGRRRVTRAGQARG